MDLKLADRRFSSPSTSPAPSSPSATAMPPRATAKSVSLSPDDACMLASLAVDFSITQLVDGTVGVHGMIPKGIFKKK